MKRLRILIPLCMLFLLTGCYNYRELTQIALTSAIGIDKNQNGEYVVTIQVLNTQKQGGDSSSSNDVTKFILYTSHGKTLQEALRTTIFNSPRRLYLNHMSLLLISENIAKEGIGDLLDFFARNTEFRKQFLVVVSRDPDPSDVMQVVTPLEALNAQNIVDSILSDAKYYGMTSKTTYEDLLKSYINPRTNIVLPSVEYIGNTEKGEGENNVKQSKPDATIELRPMAIFKDDKMIGYLTEQESRSLNYIKDKINNSILTCNCNNDGIFTAEIISSKTKLKADFEKKKITIAVEAKSNIKEINCNIDLLNSNTITEIEAIINQHLEEMIRDLIQNTLQKYQTDIFGFEELLYKSKPNEYKVLKKQYGEELLDHFDFEVVSKINVQTKGNIIKEITR